MKNFVKILSKSRAKTSKIFKDFQKSQTKTFKLSFNQEGFLMGVKWVGSDSALAVCAGGGAAATPPKAEKKKI